MARADAGLTISQLAERAGVARDTISKAEKGQHSLQANTLAKVARALGTTPSRLYADEEEKYAPKAGAPSEPGLHDPGLVPRDPEHAAELMRTAVDIAAALPAEWSREVQEFAEAGRDLPRFRPLEMQCTAIRIDQMFMSAFRFMQRQAAGEGYSPDPADWSARMQEDLIWNFATLQVLNEESQRLWNESRAAGDARAIRAEFAAGTNEELGRITESPAYSEALDNVRRMAGAA